MKKRKILVMLMSAAMLTAGCGSTQANTDAENSESADSEESTESTAALKVYESDDIEQTYDEAEAGNYTEKYTLKIINDTEAEFIDVCNHGNGYIATFDYMGTYVEDEDNNFSFTSNEFDATDVMYSIYTDGESIVSVNMGSMSEDATVIAGTYTCEADEDQNDGYGDLTLTIVNSSDVTLTTGDGTTYSGSLIYLDDKWDFMTNNDEDGTPGLDWYIYLDGDTFTYQPYLNATYGEYAGTYDCFGALGEFTVQVDDNGTAYADVTLDGADLSLSGSVSFDSESKTVTNFYLSNEEGYSLSLDIYLLDDGTYSYSGYYTQPISVG